MAQKKIAALWCILLVFFLIFGVSCLTRRLSPSVPDPSPPPADLVSLSWVQNHMCWDDCFSFGVYRSEDAPYLQGHYLSKSTKAERTLEQLPLSEIQWAQLESYLRTHSFAPRQEPIPGIFVSDATESNLSITWNRNGQAFTEQYNGEYESELRDQLTDIAETALAQKATKPVLFPQDSTT